MSSKEMYKQWQAYEQENARQLNKALAKMFLGMPIPMSYEVWSYLHEQVDEVKT